MARYHISYTTLWRRIKYGSLPQPHINRNTRNKLSHIEDLEEYEKKEDWASFFNGILHGVLIDATQDIEDIQEQINDMLASSPEEDAEECAIHDYEGFAGYSVSEYKSIQRAHEVACFLEEHGKIAGDLLSHFGG